jgi:hypothetical protein
MRIGAWMARVFEYALQTSDKCIITRMSQIIVMFRIEIRENGELLQRKFNVTA